MILTLQTTFFLSVIYGIEAGLVQMLAKLQYDTSGHALGAPAHSLA